MKTDSTEVADADLNAIFQLIDRQTATIERQAATIDDIMAQLTRATAIIEKQGCQFYRVRSAAPVQDMVPINDWIH